MKKELYTYNGIEFDLTWSDSNEMIRHGGPFDRGGADSYYHRAYNPHWWPHGTNNGECITWHNMSNDEILQYTAGYERNEELGDKKDWG